MKTKAIRDHQVYYAHSSSITSMMAAIVSIVKFIIIVLGIALMVFK